MEDMSYEIEPERSFVGLRLGGPPSAEATILNFRHLLEKHDFGRTLFEEINAQLASRRYHTSGGDDRGRAYHLGGVDE